MAGRGGRERVSRWLALMLAFGLIAAACGGGAGEESPAGGGGDAEVLVQEPGDSVGADDVGDGDGAGAAAPEATEPEAPQPDAEQPDDGQPADAAEDEPLTVPVDSTTTTVPSEVQPQFGGTLRVGVEAEGDGLNPAANSFAVSAYVMTYPMFDPLAYYDTSGRPIPYLAESFTKIGDGSVWQMRLREGVRFHDGTDLDAGDVIATFQAQLADPVISLAVRPAFGAENAIAKIDDLTVEFRLSRPVATFPAYVTGQLGMVLPSEWLGRALQDASLNQMPVGQGPFMIESRVQDEVTVLVRNPDYWAADLIDVYLDRIEVYPITDPQIAAERVAAGDLDLVVTANAEATLTLREAEGVTTIENVRSSEHVSMMNTTRPPFDDLRARQALTFAADQDAYVALIRQGTAPAAHTMFHPDLVWSNPDIVQETNMPERAAPLVASYCADFPSNCSDGRINVTLSHSGPSVEQTRTAELQADTWGDFFNVGLAEALQDDLIVQVVLGDYEVVNWRHFGSIEPDSSVLWLSCESIGFIALNFPRYCDPQRDEWMYEQRASEDLDRRVELWHRIQESMRDSYAYIFWSSVNWTIGARDNVNNICGQTSPADGTELFCNNQGNVQLHQVWLS